MDRGGGFDPSGLQSGLFVGLDARGQVVIQDLPMNQGRNMGRHTNSQEEDRHEVREFEK